MTAWQIWLAVVEGTCLYIFLMGLTYRYAESWDVEEWQNEEGKLSNAQYAFWFATFFPLIYWPCRWGAIIAEKIVARRKRKSLSPD